jgi:hypothetical protein
MQIVRERYAEPRSLKAHGKANGPMTTEECHERANQCAAHANVAASEPMALEFLKLAAQWRAIAVRTIYLGPVEATIEAPVLRAPKLRPI